MSFGIKRDQISPLSKLTFMSVDLSDKIYPVLPGVWSETKTSEIPVQSLPLKMVTLGSVSESYG